MESRAFASDAAADIFEDATLDNVPVASYLMARGISPTTPILPIFECESGVDSLLVLNDDLRTACIQYQSAINSPELLARPLFVKECPLLLACLTGRGHATLIIVLENTCYGFGFLVTNANNKLPDERDLCSFMSPDPIFKPFKDTGTKIKAILPFSLDIADIFRTKLQSSLQETSCLRGAKPSLKIVTDIPYRKYRGPLSIGENCASFAELIPGLEAGYYGFSNPSSMRAENGGAVFLSLGPDDELPEQFLIKQFKTKTWGDWWNGNGKYVSRKSTRKGREKKRRKGTRKAKTKRR
jgi:hypothetical protein